jgi:hypothetical protein
MPVTIKGRFISALLWSSFPILPFHDCPSTETFILPVALFLRTTTMIAAAQSRSTNFHWLVSCQILRLHL